MKPAKQEKKADNDKKNSSNKLNSNIPSSTTLSNHIPIESIDTLFNIPKKKLP